MTSTLGIIGAGGHGREALMVARALNRIDRRWDEIVFIDDGRVDAARVARVDTRLLGSIESTRPDDIEHVIAVGDPDTRQAIDSRLGNEAKFASLIDPGARIGPDVVLGDGFMAYPGAVVTTNVRIGRHTHINCAAVVSHDCRIGNFVSLSPGVMINGEVEIGDGVFLGTGAIVLPGRRIGQGAVIGAGAVVVDDVAPQTTAIGAPARVVASRNRSTAH